MAGKLKRRSRSTDCLWFDQSPEGGNNVRAIKPVSKLSHRDLEDKHMNINAASTKVSVCVYRLNHGYVVLVHVMKGCQGNIIN